ncbi:MAG TPA: DUF1707 domain-containing protein [Chloroflexota bacterium]|nr:DUF1707 domain-containing protein [Chloroflexota bacterium]
MDDNAGLIGDDQRETALVTLKSAYGDGRLTFEEFTERTTAAVASRTSHELAISTTGLAHPAVIPAGTHATRRLISLWRPSEHMATWRAAGRVSAIAAWAPCTLDLRHVRIEGDDLEIRAVALWSTVTVRVPHGVEIEVTGGGMLRDRRTHLSSSGPLPGAPRIRLRAISLWADVILVD